MLRIAQQTSERQEISTSGLGSFPSNAPEGPSSAYCVDVTRNYHERPAGGDICLPSAVGSYSRTRHKRAYQCKAPNTFETIALPAAAGFCLMACSSSPIIKYNPSKAFSVTYVSMLAASPLTRPSLAPSPAN